MLRIIQFFSAFMASNILRHPFVKPESEIRQQQQQQQQQQQRP